MPRSPKEDRPDTSNKPAPKADPDIKVSKVEGKVAEVSHESVDAGSPLPGGKLYPGWRNDIKKG